MQHDARLSGAATQDTVPMWVRIATRPPIIGSHASSLNDPILSGFDLCEVKTFLRDALPPQVILPVSMPVEPSVTLPCRPDLAPTLFNYFDIATLSLHFLISQYFPVSRYPIRLAEQLCEEVACQLDAQDPSTQRSIATAVGDVDLIGAVLLRLWDSCMLGHGK